MMETASNLVETYFIAISPEIAAILEIEDSHKESFIWRGPALYLKQLAEKKGKQDPISIYYWRRRIKKDDILTKDDFADVKDLEETIEEIISKVPKTEAWNDKKLGHVMLLMLDMLNVVQLATLEEIVRFLNLFGLKYEKQHRTSRR